MEDKIRCPNCRKINEIQKFCIFCGQQLLRDDEMKLRLKKPEPYCLNCGRPVSEDQIKCDCGYEFRDIACPKCGSKNAYANKFCMDCGEKLWRSEVNDNYRYYRRFFDSKLFSETVLPALRHTSLYGRYRLNKQLSFPDDAARMAQTIEKLKTDELKMDAYLAEAASRWKIVSPYYCLSCLNIMGSEDWSCKKCGFHSGDMERVRYLKIAVGSYVKPAFNMADLKWSSKYSDNFAGSLAPSIGESQFEYRERLKWEFSEIIDHKKSILSRIKALKHPKKTVVHSSRTSSQTHSRKVKKPEPVVDEGEIVRESFPYQFQEFSRNVRDICRDNGGDISQFNEGILGCPNCSKDFHYLSSRFLETRRCPHCGLHFNITAPIYENEWDASGISFDEYVLEYYGFRM